MRKYKYQSIGKKKLLKFVEMLANEIEYKYDIMWFINRFDIDEIKKWDNEVCDRIWKEIENKLKYKKLTQKELFYAFNLFCIYYNKYFRYWFYSYCENCGYGKRHGNCINNNKIYTLSLDEYKEIIDYVNGLYKSDDELQKEIKKIVEEAKEEAKLWYETINKQIMEL